MAASSRFTLTPRGSFSLEMIRTFGCGLFAASRHCSADRDRAILAFPLDGTHELVGVQLEQRGERLDVEVVGSHELERVRRQLERILSLDHDGDAFTRVLQRDPVLTRAAADHPGFRPPIFYSPYAAAGWLVMTQRLRQSQAAQLVRAIAHAGGDEIEIGGQRLTSFPRPETLLRWSHFPGVPGTKWARLQAVARAALEGRLDVDRLVTRTHAQVRSELMAIFGIGEWTADGIWLRGCGLADAFIVTEPRVQEAVASAYGLDEVPDDAEFARLAEGWRPFRAWVTVLLTLRHHRSSARSFEVLPSPGLAALPHSALLSESGRVHPE